MARISERGFLLLRPSKNNKWITFKWFLLILIKLSILFSLAVTFLFTDGKVNRIHNSEFADFLQFLVNGTEYGGVDKYASYIMGVMQSPSDVINDVDSFRYPIETGPCPAERDKGYGLYKMSLFVGVMSEPGNFKRRHDIRRTWKNHLNNPIMTQQQNSSVHIVGFGFVTQVSDDADVQSRIVEESRTFGDVLQVQPVSGYVSVGVAFFNWLSNNCPNVDYVLKVDDNIYVNIYNLTSVIASLPIPAYYYPINVYGFNQTGVQPKRGDNYFIFVQFLPLQFN